MGAKKMPNQIKKVKAGDRLKFIRDAFDGTVWYRKGRIVEIIDHDNSVSLAAMTAPLRDIDNTIRPEYVFRMHGFRYCRFIEPQLLIENCRRV